MQANTLVFHPWGLGFFLYVFCIDVTVQKRRPGSIIWLTSGTWHKIKTSTRWQTISSWVLEVPLSTVPVRHTLPNGKLVANLWKGIHQWIFTPMSTIIHYIHGWIVCLLPRIGRRWRQIRKGWWLSSLFGHFTGVVQIEWKPVFNLSAKRYRDAYIEIPEDWFWKQWFVGDFETSSCRSTPT